MAINIQWYNNEKQTLRVVIEGHWDWDNVREVSAKTVEMAQSVNYPIALIVVLPSDFSLPPSGFAQHSHIVSEGHAKAELHTIVYITKNFAIKTLWEETIKAVAADVSRYFVLGSEEDALELIASRAP